MECFFGQIVDINKKEFNVDFINFQNNIAGTGTLNISGYRVSVNYTDKATAWYLPIYSPQTNTVIFALELGDRAVNTKLKIGDVFFIINTGTPNDGQNYYEYVAIKAQNITLTEIIGGTQNVRTPI